MQSLVKEPVPARWPIIGNCFCSLQNPLHSPFTVLPNCMQQEGNIELPFHRAGGFSSLPARAGHIRFNINFLMRPYAFKKRTGFAGALFSYLKIELLCVLYLPQHPL